MKLMLVRVQQGTFIGQVKPIPMTPINNLKLDLTKLYFPAMVDFMTLPSQSPLGKLEIKTTLHLADWPCSEMIIDSTPILHSIIDTDQLSDFSKMFVDAYLTCIDQAWKNRKIIN